MGRGTNGVPFGEAVEPAADARTPGEFQGEPGIPAAFQPRVVELVSPEGEARGEGSGTACCAGLDVAQGLDPRGEACPGREHPAMGKSPPAERDSQRARRPPHSP